MINKGTLVKSTLGPQTTNGLLNQGEVRVDTPRPGSHTATLEKIEAQSSLRLSVKQARPGLFYSTFVVFITDELLVIQARNFAFLKGFLPHYAKQQLVSFYIIKNPH